MPFYEIDTLKNSVIKYLLVGVTCFSVGYLKGCEHGELLGRATAKDAVKSLEQKIMQMPCEQKRPEEGDPYFR